MPGFLRADKRKNFHPCVTILPSGRMIETNIGTSLLTALIAAGELSTIGQCGGQAQCGTCRVVIKRGSRSLSKVSDKERQHLAQLGSLNVLNRLACQALLGMHNVTIELM